MRKPFENKQAYDPGRLRHKITFVQDQTLPNDNGGTTFYELNVLNTWAGKENVGSYTASQIKEEADVTVEKTPTYFIVRNRKDFYPNKTMYIKIFPLTAPPEYWAMLKIEPMDDPCTFIKILCVRSR